MVKLRWADMPVKGGALMAPAACTPGRLSILSITGVKIAAIMGAPSPLELPMS
jgi:hypothetical protein